MKTLTLVTQKGGVGKTTLAASIAVAASQAGEKVAALDLDPQGSLAEWGDTREADSIAVDRIAPDQVAQLPQILQALKGQGFTFVVLDTAGSANTTNNLAMKEADLCLLLARPSKLDLKATLPTIEALMRLEMKERFAFLLNQCPPGRSSRAAEAANGLSMFGILAEPAITQLVDHQDAIAVGKGVTEYAPEGKASEEIRNLWAWIARKTKGK
jgi:chromosome partitioning protein